MGDPVLARDLVDKAVRAVRLDPTGGEDLAAPEDSSPAAEKIVETLAAPIDAAGELLRTSPSIRISLYPGDGPDPDFLLKFADIAMYQPKG